MAREINLVPDIKDEMIKTLKLRNLIFFLCIIVASASVAVTVIFGIIVGGQQIAINNKNNVLKSFSEKLNSYSDRDEFLKIKDQLGNISTLTENKIVASRTFNILSALIPQDGLDEILISELSIDLTEGDPVFVFEAQANAGQAPFFDYRVLDSFKKSMQYMRYDYGHYVDAENNEIPAYCILERDASGAHFYDPATKDLFAYWTIEAEGCNTFTQENEEDSENENSEESNSSLIKDEISRAGYTAEDYNGSTVVRIWRTPQLSWYKDSPKADEPQITESGEIKNVAHFESECINYNLVFKNNKLVKIEDTDNSCILVPGESDEERMEIIESTNGRDSSEQLVLRFTARIVLEPEVYNFNNFHMLALGPSERRNVTDSYVQLQSIFAERAKDCQEGDTACKTEGRN